MVRSGRPSPASLRPESQIGPISEPQVGPEAARQCAGQRVVSHSQSETKEDDGIPRCAHGQKVSERAAKLTPHSPAAEQPVDLVEVIIGPQKRSG